MKRSKKLLSLFSLLLIICFAAGCESAEETAPTLVQQTVSSVEVGEKVGDFTTFFTCQKGASIELGDLSEIDTYTVGTYDIPAIIHYKKAVVPMKYPFEVVDTTPPELTVDKTKIEIYLGMDYKPDEMIKATATDNSGEDVKIDFISFPMITDRVLNSSGKITATDKSGNSASKDIDVSIKGIKTETDLREYLDTILSTSDDYKGVTYNSEHLNFGENITTLSFPITELNTNNNDIVGGYCAELEITDQRSVSFSNSPYYLEFQPFLELRFQKNHRYLTTDKIVIKSSAGSTELVGSPFDGTTLKIKEEEKNILYGNNPTLVVYFDDGNGNVTIPLSSTDIDKIKNAFKLQNAINKSIPMY